MPDSFGARLRQRREERQIDLIAISEGTKIKLPLLEALERDDVSHWPSGIFRRAYIRAYAQMIGLDPDVVLREFLEVHADPGDAFVVTAATAAAAEEEFAKSGGASTRLRTIVDSAIGSLTKLRRQAMAEGRRPGATPARTAEPQAADPHAADPDLFESEVEEPVDALHQSAEVGTQEAVLDDDHRAEALVTPAAAPRAESIGGAPASAPSTSAEPEWPAAADPVARAIASEVAAESARAAQAAVDAIAAQLQAVHDSTLQTVARLCTDFGRVGDRSGVQQLLRDSAQALQASGLIVWLFDEMAEGLMPVLVHGYSEKVLAQLPAVRPDADNATAAAYRTGSTCEVVAAEHTTGAVVVPLLTGEGCTGVLAIELQQGIQPSPSTRAVATILAATLTQLVLRSRQAPTQGQSPATAQQRPPTHPVNVRR
jgi:cytoskeletal protein RodZ